MEYNQTVLGKMLVVMEKCLRSQDEGGQGQLGVNNLMCLRGREESRGTRGDTGKWEGVLEEKLIEFNSEWINEIC